MKKSTLLFILLLTLQSSAFDKKSIAIFELDAQGVSKQEALAFTDRIRNEIFKTGKYLVLERQMMEEVLKEQGFQLTACTSSECMIQAGKILGVQILIAGSVSKVGNMYTISIRSIDVASGTVINIAAVDYEGSIEGAAKKACPEVAAKLVGEPVEKKGGNTWLYIGGGILLAGGAAAYFLASNGDEDTTPNGQGSITVTVPLIP